MQTLFSELHTHHEHASLFGPGRIWLLKESETSLKNWLAQCGERAQGRIVGPETVGRRCEVGEGAGKTKLPGLGSLDVPCVQFVKKQSTVAPAGLDPSSPTDWLEAQCWSIGFCRHPGGRSVAAGTVCAGLIGDSPPPSSGDRKSGRLTEQGGKMLLRATHAKLMAAIASDPVGVELLKSRTTALEGRGRPPLPDVMEMQHFLCEVLCCWRTSEWLDIGIQLGVC